MADIQLDIEFEDGGAINGFAKLQQQAEQTDRKMQQLGNTANDVFEGVAKDIDKANEATRQNIAVVGKQISAVKMAEIQNKQWKTSLKSLADQTDILGVNLGGLIDNLKNKRAQIKTTITSLRGLTGGLKLFKLALAATGVGVLIVALGSLVALLQRNQKAIDFVNRSLAGIGAAIDVVVDRAAVLGGAIVKLFSGDFVGAANDAKTAVQGVTDEIIKETQQAAKLAGVIQNLTKQESLLGAQQALNQARIAELNKQVENQNSNTRARIKALNELDNLLDKNAQTAENVQKGFIAAALGQTQFDESTQKVIEGLRNVDVASREGLEAFDELQGKLGLSLSTDVDNTEFLTLVKELGDIEKEKFERETEFQNKRNEVVTQGADKRRAQLEAEQKALAELAKNYETVVSKFNDVLNSADFDTDTDTDLGRLERERNLAVSEVQQLKKEVLAAAAALGKTLPDSFDKDIDKLLSAIEKRFLEGVKELRAKVEPVDLLPPTLSERDFKKEGIEIGEDLAAGIAEGTKPTDDLTNTLARIGETIKGSLGISDETFDFLISQIQSLAGTLVDSFTTGIDGAINQQERLIEALDEQVSATEDTLEREFELKKLGLANNFDLEKQNLEKLQSEQAAALAEREKLKEKAAKREIAINGAVQASEIVLAGAKAFKAHADLPFVGIGIAIGFIATILSTVSKLKKQTATTKLFTGGRIPLTGRDDRTGRGHQIEDTNIEVGRGEWVINAKDSEEQNSILEGINAGRFRGINLAAMAEQVQQNDYLGGSVASIERTQAKVVQIKEVRGQRREAKQEQDMKAAIEQGMSKHTTAIIKAMQEKPDRVPLGDGTYYEITEKANQIIKKKVKVS